MITFHHYCLHYFSHYVGGSGHTKDYVCPSHVTHHLKTRTYYFYKVICVIVC